jgi:hypothetical protein
VRRVLALWTDRLANDEPFDPEDINGKPHWQFGWIAHRPAGEWLDHLAAVCRAGWTVKHVYDLLPLRFNLDLARAATAAGHRHVHLDRLDAAARLASLGVAIASGRWTREGRGTYRGEPLDVPWLVARHREHVRQWRAIAPALPCRLELRAERLARGADFEPLARFLGVPRGLWERTLPTVDELARTGGQDTAGVLHRVPNLAELRAALAAIN